MENFSCKEDKYKDITFRYLYNGLPDDKNIMFFFHGFDGDRYGIEESWAERIVAIGYVLIIIDAYEHGDRMSEEYKGLNNAQRQKVIIDTEIQTAKDAIKIYDYLTDKKEISKDKMVGVMGVSMGAAVTFYLASLFHKVNLLVSIIGSPSFVEFYQYKQKVYQFEKDNFFRQRLSRYKKIDPLINSKSLEGKDILMTVGLRDKIVPLEYAKDLSRKIPSTYLEYDVEHECPVEMMNDVFSFIKGKS